MTATAIIGCDTPLGQYWSGKRYFDCLINDQNFNLLKGRQFGEIVLICPSLWDAPEAVQTDFKPFSERVLKLMENLGDAKIERLTYVTSLDLIQPDGNESSSVEPEDESSYQGILAGFQAFLNLQFGRVITLRVPELVGFGEGGTGWSVLGELAAADKKKHKPKVGLLTKHQFYPIDHIVNDAETAWECGASSINLVSEPVTSFELTERLFPKLVDSLPVAREKDPAGSQRTSLYSIYLDDAVSGYIIDKERLLEELKALK